MPSFFAYLICWRDVQFVEHGQVDESHDETHGDDAKRYIDVLYAKWVDFCR